MASWPITIRDPRPGLGPARRPRDGPALAGRPGRPRRRARVPRPPRPGRVGARPPRRRWRGSPTALHALLPRCPDPGMALTNLERFVAAEPAARGDARGPGGRPADDSRSCVQLFSTSQYFSELMIRDPASLDWLRDGAERRDRDDPDRRPLGRRCARPRTRRPSAWPCGGSGSARCSGSATTTSCAACRWR